MSKEILREKFATLGTFPGLSEWFRKTVLKYRCKDITEEEFMEKVNSLHQRTEELYDNLQPEAMDEESYMVAREYYEVASRSVDHYLLGLERLLDWAETGDDKMMDAASLQFETGDALTPKVMMAYLDLQDNFIDSAKAVAKSAGLDVEGIG